MKHLKKTINSLRQQVRDIEPRNLFEFCNSEGSAMHNFINAVIELERANIKDKFNAINAPFKDWLQKDEPENDQSEDDQGSEGTNKNVTEGYTFIEDKTIYTSVTDMSHYRSYQEFVEGFFQQDSDYCTVNRKTLHYLKQKMPKQIADNFDLSYRLKSFTKIFIIRRVKKRNEKTQESPFEYIHKILHTLKGCNTVLEENYHTFNGVDLSETSNLAHLFNNRMPIIVPISSLEKAINSINDGINARNYSIKYKKMGDFVMFIAI